MSFAKLRFWSFRCSCFENKMVEISHFVRIFGEEHKANVGDFVAIRCWRMWTTCILKDIQSNVVNRNRFGLFNSISTVIVTIYIMKNMKSTEILEITWHNLKKQRFLKNIYSHVFLFILKVRWITIAICLSEIWDPTL